LGFPVLWEDFWGCNWIENVSKSAFLVSRKFFIFLER
jgi:hypothetical protein